MKPFTFTFEGTPLYRTTTVAFSPSASGLAGVMLSSCAPEVAKRAFLPSTRTSLTSSAKSRLKRDRSWVAVASRVAVPLSSSVFGW